MELLESNDSKSGIRVLVVSDDQAQCNLMEKELAKITSFSVKMQQCSTTTTALATLKTQQFDICLVEDGSNSENAVNLLEALNATQSQVPIIVVTADDEDNLSAILLSQGAVEFINKKELNPEILSRSIRFAILRNQIDHRVGERLPDTDTTEENEPALS